ncbi:interferon-induced protein 44 isoform X2 [Peromyscus californicus insignis]|uniref:interferon-induced protein 44 isoform X2 n=1 Tax=Peromyscus californicus insignis TaxID=564181 RepID=UPI0022A7E165|nr:interferon-induced protein 44 isoform X2 [Peromyscus californicus insignis]
MAMKTRLTWLQEKCLQNYFGGKRFCLLYKATLQNFSHRDLLWKCWDHGPTMTVFYSRNCVVGAYLQEGFQNKNVPITLFVLRETEVSACAIGAHKPSFLFYDRENTDCIPDIYVVLYEKNMTISSEVCEKLGLPRRYSTMSIQECETFRCEELLDERKTRDIAVIQRNLLTVLSTYKPYGDLVPQTRILLLGPIGAGKSSFVNSVKSVFRGSITHQALVGCDKNGISDKFNSMKPITSNHPNYIHNPLLKDRIHCVVFVFDINSVEQLSHGLVAKIKRIRRELIKCGILHVALLTHVDSLDLITREDLVDIYNCEPVKLKLEAVHRDFGFALSDILVISNYVSEWHLDPVKNMVILSALREILHTANDFLEDLPLNKQVSEKKHSHVCKKEEK